ncbi:unnamed protein product, partial [Ectocarpus sp. 4 AP-2014]
SSITFDWLPSPNHVAERMNHASPWGGSAFTICAAPHQPPVAPNTSQLSQRQATRDNRPLRVCPGCNTRLKACPNFVDHMVARQEHGEGIYHTVTTASSQTY